MHPNNLLTINAVEACQSRPLLTLFASRRIATLVADFPLSHLAPPVHPHPHTIIPFACSPDPLDAFSPEAIRAGLAEAQKVAAGSGSEAEKAEAAIEVSVFEALQNSLKA